MYCTLFYYFIIFLTVQLMFLKDCQPHPDPDSGANHGQRDLPSDQKMWPELYVSSAGTQGLIQYLSVYIYICQSFIGLGLFDNITVPK